MASSRRLKHDALGTIERQDISGRSVIVRRTVHAKPGLRLLAALLARREQRALQRLNEVPGVPEPLGTTREETLRSFLPGEPMHGSTRPDPGYFRDARRLLRRIHRRGVTHNDLAKEGNWLITADRRCALVDFQLATLFSGRSRRFRLLAHEDLRHLLKHKRTYTPELLTRRERRILNSPSVPAKLWRRAVKPVYLFVTRRILLWPERQGPLERGVCPQPAGTDRRP